MTQNDVNLKILRKEEIEASKVKELYIGSQMIDIRLTETKGSKISINLLGNEYCENFSFKIDNLNENKYLITANSEVSGLVLEIKIPVATKTNCLEKIFICQDNSKTEIQSFVNTDNLLIVATNSKITCYANFKKLFLDISATKVNLSLCAQQDIELSVFSKKSVMDFSFENLSNSIKLYAKNVFFIDNHKTVGPYKVYGILDLEDSSFTFN